MTPDMTTASAIRFVLNGRAVSFAGRPDTTALDVIRNHLGLKGTKEGCAEGDCGACTVLVRRDDAPRQAANACIMTAAQLDGVELVTVEGLKQDGVMSPLQVAMTANGSSQCGFCTPGIIMTAVEIVGRGQKYTRDALRKEISGHLCRCTGYQNIINAIEKAVEIIDAQQN